MSSSFYLSYYLNPFLHDLPRVGGEPDGHGFKVDDERPLVVCGYQAGRDVLAHGEGEHQLRRSAGNP